MIRVEFEPGFYKFLFAQIRAIGVAQVLKDMLDDGYHPSFARVAIRRVIKGKGW